MMDHDGAERMRAQGLRPVQIWVPDTRAPGFAEEYRRQCRRVMESSEGMLALVDWDAWIDDGNAEANGVLSRLERGL